jgi:predicted nucleic acid-binding Zn ribbon protein
MAKGDKLDIRNAKRSAAAMKKGGLRVSNSQASTTNQRAKARVKDGMMEKGMNVKSSGFKTTKSNSAKMPSVASKANAKNKMKAQGAKIGSSATSGYGKTKPKGK